MLALLSMMVLTAGPGPGSYVASGGWGSLEVKKGGAFTLETVGANAHTCQLEGTFQGEKATLADSGEGACVVTAAVGQDGTVAVSGTDGCRAYCGVRASFEGTYLVPPKGCAAGEVAAARRDFKKRFDAKKWAEAIALLRPVVDHCGEVLSRDDTGWVRNDLALAYLKAGQKAQCLEALEPLREVGELTAEQLEERFPPADLEVWRPIARATRTNLGLCSKK